MGVRFKRNPIITNLWENNQNLRWIGIGKLLLGGATLPTHKMQGTFLNFWKSVDLVFARALNNEARYNDVDFRRLKANVSNTGRFVCDTDFYKQKGEA